MSQSFKLFRLQQIDSELDKGEARLKEIAVLLEDKHKEQLSQERLEIAKEGRDEAAKQLRRAEQEVQAQRVKIDRSETALYGGKVVNPKELQDLQLESEALKRYLSTLEDLQLEAMLTLDDAEMNHLEASETNNAVIAEVAQQKDNLNDEKTNLRQDIERQESERQAAASNLIAQDIRIYESLRQQKNGIAVARVIEQTCAACGSTLSAATFSSAQVPSKITRCDTCGRILYVG
jgi:hypothetical protein